MDNAEESRPSHITIVREGVTQSKALCTAGQWSDLLGVS